MNHDLPELLDLLGPRATLKDRATLSQLVSKEDICTFNLKINKIQPASSDLKEKRILMKYIKNLSMKKPRSSQVDVHSVGFLFVRYTAH